LPSTLRVERLEVRQLLAAVDSLRFSEIMYHPAEPSGGPFAKDDFEFIELVNTAAEPIQLAGVELAVGATFNFATSPVQTLAGGERVLIVKNVAAFESRYGAGLPIAGVFGGALANGDDQLDLLDFDTPVQSVTYKDAWRPVTDGDGFSLTVVDPAAAPAMWNNAANYRGSLRGGGSPGTSEAPLHAGDIVINELLAHTDVDPGDWIELHNVTDQAINISDWFLSDKGSELNRYRIADDAFIPAGGYFTFTQQDDFDDNDDPGALVPFGLSEHGEAVFLSSWDSNGLTASYAESQPFRASDREVSFGRYRNSTGEVMFVEQSASTFNAENAAPLVGPVVISELMYNQAGAGSEHEFIELYNTSATPIVLFDPLHPENTWKFTNGIDFIFPTGVTIPAHGYLVIASIDPAAFRAANNVPAEVQVFGLWLGGLDKNGESLSLSRPGDPELVDGFVPYYRADHVNYDDAAPWPSAADGDGPSLDRQAMNLFGNDPASWQASAEIGGTPGRPAGAIALEGDTNGDGQVNVIDLNNVRNNFGADGPGVVGDTDGNNRVDVSDLNAVRNNFGASLPNPSPLAAAPQVVQTSAASRVRSVSARQALTSQHDAALGELLLEWNAQLDRAAKRIREPRLRS